MYFNNTVYLELLSFPKISLNLVLKILLRLLKKLPLNLNNFILMIHVLNWLQTEETLECVQKPK